MCGFRKTLSRRYSTVDAVMNSRVAISALVEPAAACPATCRSCGVRATLKQYRHSEAVTDIIDFPDRGHSLTIDAGWREVAGAALTWLRQQSL